MPNKVKTFLWRASTDSVPTLQNLLKRKIVPLSTCNLCKSYEEITCHALWFCEKIQSVWSMSFCSLPSEFYRTHSFADLLKLFLSSSQNANLFANLFAMVCWTIWNKRNKAWVEEAVCPLNRLLEMTKQYLEEFHKVRIIPQKKVRTQRPSWKPLNRGNIKNNLGFRIQSLKVIPRLSSTHFDIEFFYILLLVTLLETFYLLLALFRAFLSLILIGKVMV